MSSSVGTIQAAVAASSIWPAILIDSDLVTVGRAEPCSVSVPHPSMSRQHLQLRRKDGQVEIEDLDSRFGTFVNGARIRRTMLRLNDMVRFGSSPPYRFDGSALNVVTEGTGMAIALKDVAICRGGNTILENINVQVSSGAFVGVLGPSGTGKSLLLGCLSTTIDPSRGTVEFDDGIAVNDHRDYYRSKMGVVPQDDLVFSELTVDENLETAALIRLEDRDSVPNRVAAVLQAVGMTEHRHKRVSVLSGGQRKRISTAIELLSRPRLLLLDEPTSGLDPGIQARLMEMLRTLARQGVTVICTTHTLDTVHFFDWVLVLGRQPAAASVCYFGSPRLLLGAFDVQNQADLYEKLLAPAGRQRISPGTPETDFVSSGLAGATRTKLVPPVHGPSATASRRLRQIAVVWTRSIRVLIRDPAAAAMAGLQPCVLATLALISQTNQDRSVFSMFFLVLSSLWLGMTLTVRELVRERKLYVRDRLAGLLPESYLAGKVLYGLTVITLQSVLLVAAAMLLGGLTLAATDAGVYGKPVFLLAVLVFIAVGFSGAMLGLILSTLTKTETTAVTLLPLVLIPQMLFSRVSYGDGGQGWSSPSPYGLILNGFGGGEGKEGLSGLGVANAVISLPMVTRPATATLTLLSDLPPAAVVCESLYLLIIVAAYGLGLFVLFLRSEKRWIDSRD